MTMPHELFRSIEQVLVSAPPLRTARGRHAAAAHSGLDDALVAQLDFEQSQQQFASEVIARLADHGPMTDDRDALEAFLTGLQDLIGPDPAAVLENLVSEWRAVRGTHSLPGSVMTYLRHLHRRWERNESPLLPGCLPADLDIGYHVLATGRVIGRSTTMPLREVGLVSSLTTVETLLGLQQRSWLVLGRPGSGKTTLALREAARLALVGTANANASVPAYVPLAELAGVISSGLGVYDLLDRIGARLLAPELGARIRRLAERGQVIFLMDGADEIPEALRRDVEEHIEAASDTDLGNRLVVLSRPAGLSGFMGFPVLEMAPLSTDEQRKLLVTVCGVAKTRDLLPEIASSSVLADVASTPMTLAVLALVAADAAEVRGEHIRRHSELFRTASRLLLEGRHRDGRGVRDPSSAERVLGRLSLILHAAAAAGDHEESFRIEEIEEALQHVDPTLLREWPGFREFVTDVWQASSLLFPIDALQRRFAYLHRSFREYFAAREIAGWGSDDRRAFVEQVVTDPAWPQVLILLGGQVSDLDEYMILLRSGPPDVALGVVREAAQIAPHLALDLLQLRPFRPEARKQVIWDIARKLPSEGDLAEVILGYAEAVGAKLPRIDVYLLGALVRDSLPGQADECIAALHARLPRVPDDLFRCPPALGDASYWCTVPGGPFSIGAAEDDPDRPPWVPSFADIDVPSFAIGRVPLTNAIYEIYDPDHRGRRPFQDRVPSEELDHHPVVSVTWYEAAAFCQWAAQRHPGVRLPQEWEWEKAASWTGTAKRRYPWGDDWTPALANSWEMGPNRTTAVWAYPTGASPCGALDMAGNVWEWCQDRFVEAPLDEPDPDGPPLASARGLETRRVDRGGGWYHDVGTPTTFMRAADNPSDSFSHCGLRVCRSAVTIR